MSKLKETFSCDGKWWLPDNPDETFYGTLTYRYQHGARLQLKGCFDRFFYKDIRICNPPIIIGRTDQGRFVTLYHCGLTRKFGPLTPPKGPRGPKEAYSSTFFCNIVYPDHQFQEETEITFKKIFVHFTHLDEWLQISGFDVSYDSDKETDARKIIIQYIEPKPITLKINDVFSISIDFNFEHPSGFNNLK